MLIFVLNMFKLKKKTLGDLRDRKSKPIDIYHGQDGEILWNLHGKIRWNLHRSVLSLGKTTTSYVEYKHNKCTLLKDERSKFKMTYNMLGNWSILGMSTTDYYMMSLRQNITSIEKFTSLGKLSAQLCPDAGFQILNGI